MKNFLLVLFFLGIALFTGCGLPSNSVDRDPKKAIQLDGIHTLRLPLTTVWVYEVSNKSKKDIAAAIGKVTFDSSIGIPVEKEVFFGEIPAGKTMFFAVAECDNGVTQRLSGESLDDIARALELEPENVIFGFINGELKVTEAEFKSPDADAPAADAPAAN